MNTKVAVAIIDGKVYKSVDNMVMYLIEQVEQLKKQVKELEKICRINEEN